MDSTTSSRGIPIDTVPLATGAPFHLEATVRVLQRRPTNLVDVWDPDGRYLRAFSTENGVVLLKVTNQGTIDGPDVRYTVLHGQPSTVARVQLEQLLRRVLGLDVDPEPLRGVAEGERRIASTMVALRGMRPPRFAGLFEAFGNVIPFQQVSLEAGVAVVGRLVGRFGDSVEHDGRSFHAFPDASVVAGAALEDIRACGLSMPKAKALRSVAAAIDSGELVEEELLAMSSREAARVLTEIRGIGPWSADLVLLRGLGRLDVFPPGDVGAARGLERLTGLAAGPALDGIARRFGDLRGYLYFCTLGGSLLERGLIRPAPRR